jgi:excisionase family DNA binding protein
VAQGAIVKLVTLGMAIAPYHGVSLRTARNWIRDGKLAAVKVGPRYLVDPSDVARLLTPTLRPKAAKRGRESETERIDRQLREAGIADTSEGHRG